MASPPPGRTVSHNESVIPLGKRHPESGSGTELSEATARKIARYIFVKPDLRRSDIGFVFGTYRNRHAIANHAATLYHRGCFGTIVVTGGVSRISKGRSESYWIKRILLRRGVPEVSILRENKSKSGPDAGSMFGTYWNVVHALPLLQHLDRDGKLKTITAICHAFHGRRVLMTLKCLLPAKEIRVAPFNIFDVEPERWHDEPRSRHLVLRELEIIDEFFDNGRLKEHDSATSA